MPKPRVAVVAPSVSARGGTESIFSAELEALAGAAELTLFVSSGAEQAAQYGDVVMVDVPRLPGWLRLEAWFRGATRALARRRPAFDIAYSPGMNALGVSHATLHAIFRQLMLQDNPQRWSDLTEINRTLMFRRVAQWERRLIQAPGTRLATVSTAAAGQLRALYQRSDALVLNPAPDADRFSLATRTASRPTTRAAHDWRDDEFVVVAVGNAWHSKGFDLLMQAWGLKPPHLKARLILVSKEQPARVCRRLGGCPPGVEWLDHYPDIERVYAACDLVVLPGRGETFGLPVLEAAMCGTAVLTTPWCGVSELLPAGAIVDSIDPRVWRDRMFTLAEPASGRALRDLLRREVVPPDADLRRSRFLDWVLG